MHVVAFDLESYRIRAPGMSPPPYGLACPKTVCLSWDDGETSGVVTAAEGLKKFWAWIKDPNVLLVGHNVFYDLGLLCADDERLIPWVFLALEEGRIRCTMIRSMIIANAQGELKFEYDEDLQEFKRARFDLQRCAWVYLREFLKGKKKPKKKGKGKTKVKKTEMAAGVVAYDFVEETEEEEADNSFEWQLNFDQLDGVPTSEYPPEAYQYALLDSVVGRRIFFAQEDMVQPEGIPGEVHETCAAWALHLMSIWGVRTDPDYVARFEVELREVYEEQVAIAQKHTERINGETYSLIRRGHERSRDMKAIRARIVKHYTACGLADAIPLTPKGQVSTDRECLRMLKHKGHAPDPGLMAVSQVVRVGKLISTYLRILKSGLTHPITPHYNFLIETYRTSCSKPNLQNPPRSGSAVEDEGLVVREAFVPRAGSVFAFCDYDTLELRTLAQVCLDLFGESVLAEMFRLGKDPHLMMAANTLEISYESALARYEAGDKVIENARQYSKIANYGFGGGMGPEAFVDYARGYGLEVTLEHARALHAGFRNTFPEMHKYFAHCSELTGDHGEAEHVVFVRTNMVRGRVRYTAIANGFFQHLAAFGAKEALYQAAKEMYVRGIAGATLEEICRGRARGQDSALYGCRAWLFAHDELGIEIPEYAIGPMRAAAAAERLRAVMIEKMSESVTDVPIGATVVMARHWFKGAKPIKVDGRLVPSKPEKYEVEVDGEKQKRTRWVADVAPVAVAQKLGRFAPRTEARV